MRYVVSVVALTLLYGLALASFHPWDLAFGFGLSSVLVFASRRFVFGAEGARAAGQGPGPLGRLMALGPFVAVVFWDIVVGTWEVTLVTLHLRALRKPGIVAVPIGERTAVGVSVWAIVTGLPPGSVFVDVDRERGLAWIHLLDASQPEVFREQQAEFYRRYQSKVFP